MLARRLAIGVRSSWLASATRWRCASTDCSSASSVALKLRPRRASSSSPSTSSRCERSGFPVSASVRRVKRETGASAARATSRRAPPRARCRRRRRRAGSAAAGAATRSTSVSGRATCTAPRSPRPTVSTRRWTPWTCASRVVAARRPRPRAASCAPSTGSRVAAVVGARGSCPPARRTARCRRRRRTLRRRRRDRARRPSGPPRRRRRAAAAALVERLGALAQRLVDLPAQRASASPRTAWRRAAMTVTATATPGDRGDASAEGHGSRST